MPQAKTKSRPRTKTPVPDVLCLNCGCPVPSDQRGDFCGERCREEGTRHDADVEDPDGNYLSW